MKTIVLVVLLAAAVFALAGEVDAGGLPRATLRQPVAEAADKQPGSTRAAHVIDPQLGKQPLWRCLPTAQRRALRELQRRLRW